MAHGLEIAAHDAEDHVDLASFFRNCGNDCVKRALAGGHAIGVADLGGEALATVLQRDAGLWRDDANAERVKNRNL